MSSRQRGRPPARRNRRSWAGELQVTGWPAREPSFKGWGGPQIRFDSGYADWLVQTFGREICSDPHVPILAWHFVTGCEGGARHHDEREASASCGRTFDAIVDSGYILSGREIRPLEERERDRRRAYEETAAKEQAQRANPLLAHEVGTGDDAYVFLAVQEPRYVEWGYGFAFDAEELIRGGATLGLADMNHSYFHAWDGVNDNRKGGIGRVIRDWPEARISRIMEIFWIDRYRLIDPDDEEFVPEIAEDVLSHMEAARRILRVKGREALRLLDLAADAHCEFMTAGYSREWNDLREALPKQEFRKHAIRATATYVDALLRRGIPYSYKDEDVLYPDGAPVSSNVWNMGLKSMEILVPRALAVSKALIVCDRGRPKLTGRGVARLRGRA